jgi:hypothetical protein
VIVVEDQAESTEDDDVSAGLNSDTCEQLVEWFAGYRKDEDNYDWKQVNHTLRQVASLRDSQGVPVRWPVFRDLEAGHARFPRLVRLASAGREAAESSW